MGHKYEQGQQVTVKSARGPKVRVVVEDLGNILTVCQPDELERAQRELRDPLAVGLRKEDIIAPA